MTEEKDMLIICPKCGKKVPNNIILCWQCGHKLKESLEKPMKSGRNPSFLDREQRFPKRRK